ncbi:hypothetical protein BaRGS_00001871 [Batillaria attramentaria]|uniref:Uncharacterized protein n=1 Tax=Batillaria attramentaria TaxID=370345 RepID=A0ABD0M517_9CAEN
MLSVVRSKSSPVACRGQVQVGPGTALSCALIGTLCSFSPKDRPRMQRFPVFYSVLGPGVSVFDLKVVGIALCKDDGEMVIMMPPGRQTSCSFTVNGLLVGRFIILGRPRTLMDTPMVSGDLLCDVDTSADCLYKREGSWRVAHNMTPNSYHLAVLVARPHSVDFTLSEAPAPVTFPEAVAVCTITRSSIYFRVFSLPAVSVSGLCTD